MRIPIVITYATSVATTINKKWLAELEASISNAVLTIAAETAEA